MAEKKIYCSKLPVVYIDTEDGYGITSKEVYKSATMRIQGNDNFNSTILPFTMAVFPSAAVETVPGI